MTTSALALGDVDGVGELDLVTATARHTGFAGRDRLYFNDGKGKFTNQTKPWLPARNDFTQAIVAGDFDGDRDIDIVFGNTNLASLLINNTLYFKKTRHLIGTDVVRTGTTHALHLVSWTDTQSKLRLAVPLSSLKPARIPLFPLLAQKAQQARPTCIPPRRR